ncbi:MAG: hypothetical protein AB8H80_17405 [Planctomycetota bacterium]
MSWRRILLLSTAIVVVLGIVTWAMLQNSSVATDFVRRELQQRLRPQTQLAATSVQLQAGRLAVEGLAIADPLYPERTLLRVARGHVDVQADPFGKGLALRHIAFDGVELEAGPDWPTANDLLQQPPADSESGGDIPVIEIRSGRALLHLCPDEGPLEVSELALTAAPLASDPQRLQLTGSIGIAAPRATFALTGELNLQTGGAWISLTGNDVALGKPAVARLLRLAQLEAQGLEVGGHIDEFAVLMRIPPAAAASDRTPTFEVRAECREVLFDAEELPSLVRAANVILHADTRAGGELRAEFTQKNDIGDLHVLARADGLADGLDSLTLRATGRNVRIDDDVLQALRAFPIGNRVVDALRPTEGHADIDLYLANPHLGDGDTGFDLRMRDVKMAFHGFASGDGHRIGFPIPVEHASGRVMLRDGVLLLQNTSASVAAATGGGEITLEGRIDLRQQADEGTTLDIHGRDIAFCDELRDALATLLDDDGDLYNKLAPEGRTEVHVLVRPQSELAGGFAVDIAPQSAAMQWQGFPYRLDQLTGSIRVRKETARFDIEGRHGDGSLKMNGRIPLREAHKIEDSFEAVIDVEQLAVDEDLRQGVAEVVQEIDEHWRRARPSGRLSGRVKVWRPQAADGLFHDVRLTLDGVDIELPVAPWRAKGLRGQLLVQGNGPNTRIDFDALRGRLLHQSGAAAQLALLGHIETMPKVHDLAFVVRDLELCEQLGASLDELGALDNATWQALQPSGRVDLVCRHRSNASARDGGEKPNGGEQPDGGETTRNMSAEDLQVVVQLVDVKSRAPMLPRPAEHMTGELHVEGGELTFRDVRGELGGAVVHCANGRVHQLPEGDGRTEISFDVHAKDFPVDDGLANLFSGPLKKAIRERRMRGQADVDGLRLRFRIPTAPECTKPFATTIRGAIGLDGVDMLLGADSGADGGSGIRVEDIRGLVTLSESTVTDAGGQLVGTLGRGSLSIFGNRCEALDSVFTADAERLQLGSLKARIHDGELRNARIDQPALTYLLPAPNVPEGRLSADLSFRGVDVFTLLSTSGWNNPPYTGTASGRMTLSRLDGSSVVGAEATGTLKIERADLGKVPLFTAIYAQLPAVDQPRFNQFDLSYRLDADAVVFDDLEIRSELLAAKGKGSLALDGYLDVEMEIDNLLGQSADPLVMPLIDYLAKNLVSFRLYGHLRNLQARTGFVGTGAPDRSPVLPMPPARPKPASPGY